MRLPRFTTTSDQQQGFGRQCGERKANWANALLKSSAAICVASILGGCNTRGFLSPTEMVRSGVPAEPLVVPIVSAVDPVIENGPTDYATATLPRPSDLQSSSNDYTIGRNDLLNISISDLMGPGQETLKTTRVSESGNVSLPYLGSVRAGGLTEIELEQAITQAYRDANIIQNAQVSVTVIEARGRTVEILGAVAAPGQYAILDADFRLLDALVLAKDTTTPLVEYIYVIRKSESQRMSAQPTSRPMPNVHPNAGGPDRPKSAPAPDDLAPSSSVTQQPSVAETKAGSSNQPLTLLADAALVPDDLAPEATTRSAPGNLSAPSTVPSIAPAVSTSPFEFDSPENPGNTRIIRIPYQALRQGDLSYNIAVHPRDIVVVQQLPVGEYYMGGHIARPGAFSLTGRRITLKEAVISAGMFDELAIPQRTDVIRRIKPDREVFVRVDLERIFSGEQPDLYLKPDDQVIVGTNALAPFLSAARGAFRITYGFGFLYDRNFAYSTNTNGGGL